MSEAPREYPEDDSRLSESVTDNAQRIFGYLLADPKVVAAGITQQETIDFLRQTVFPAITVAREEHNATMSRRVSRLDIQRALRGRFQEISLYASGLTPEEVAQQTGVEPVTVRTNITRTFRQLRASPKYGPEYFSRALAEQYPHARLKARVQPSEKVQKIEAESPPQRIGRAVVRATSPLEDMPREPVVPSAELNPRPTKEGSRKVGVVAARGAGWTAGRTREIEGHDSVGLYLDEIARTPLLEAAQEVELSKVIEAGLFAEHLLAEGRVGRKKGGAPSAASEEELIWLAEEGRKAVDQFINANLRLVVSIARKYGRSQMPMLDLIQEGNTGLIRAVEKFDYTKGYKFSTYATWWVRQAVTRGIAQQARIVRLPVHVVEELNQVGGARRTLEKQLGRNPSAEEIAAELGKDTERVLNLVAWGRDHISLDTPVDDDGETSLGDLMEQETTQSPDDVALDRESRQRLAALVGQLDDRSAYIIRARYGLLDGHQHTQAVIGAHVGISAERVRQLEREALEKLRTLGDPDLAS